MLSHKSMIICSTLMTLFLVLAIIHFYWGFGGRWAFTSAIPVDSNNNPVLSPTAIDCFIVGIGLLLFGIFYLLQTDLISFNIIYWIRKPLLWVIPLIFLFRAIGDFKYVGFFKSMRTSEFATLDYFFFSPLCLAISILGFWVLKKV
ncbi:DUF3995 domain-containing protein [Ekhidna sp.]|uniref:DUF3995 domain-containing protein n=1 Tax=Ekhidna sp. TaxID=2608089 RepID=UPI003CCC2362